MKRSCKKYENREDSLVMIPKIHLYVLYISYGDICWKGAPEKCPTISSRRTWLVPELLKYLEVRTNIAAFPHHQKSGSTSLYCSSIFICEMPPDHLHSQPGYFKNTHSFTQYSICTSIHTRLLVTHGTPNYQPRE